MENYSIPKTSFSSSIWIKEGSLFNNVNLIEIELANEGAFRLELFDASNKLLGKSSRPNPRGGWHTFTPANMEPPVHNGPYKLKLVNEAPGVRQVRGGNVHY